MLACERFDCMPYATPLGVAVAGRKGASMGRLQTSKSPTSQPSLHRAACCALATSLN